MTLFSLLALPNELLHKIFSDELDWTDEHQIVQLFRTSLTCRRLHDICLTSYLVHFGISHPTEYSHFVVRNAVNPQHDAITGLRAATFVQSVKHLYCVFEDHDHSYPRAVPPQSSIAKTVERLRFLVDKLHSIIEVTIRFSGRDWNNSSVHGSDASLTAWSSAIGSLLNACLDKGCTSMCIIDGKVMNYAYQFVSRPSRGQIAPVHGFAGNFLQTSRQNPMRGVGWEFKRVKMGDMSVLVEPAPPHHALEKLALNSPMLVLPPLSNWTVSVLPTLKELSITGIALANHIWQALLPCLATPDLQILSIAACPDITIDDILRFLAFLPRLTHLRLSDEEQYLPASGIPIPQLKDLQKLEGPWRVLTCLVQCPLPEILEVRTFPKRTPRRGIDWEGTGGAMRSLRSSLVDMGCLERLPLVALRVLVDTGLIARLGVSPSMSVKRALRLINVLEIEFDVVRLELEVLASWITEVFESVKEIRIYGNHDLCCGSEEDIVHTLRTSVVGASSIVIVPLR